MGHPDKICDRISDAVLDAILEQDSSARVACETFTTTGLVCLMGEITTSASYNVEEIARKTIADIGYVRAKFGFDAETCAVINSIHGQSPDIAMGVDMCLEAKEGETDGLDTGAGDQGLMFGYACSETPELMPLPISLAHALAKKLDRVRSSKLLPYLRPDGKTQVTIEYDGDEPVRAEALVVSCQHDPDMSIDEIRKDIEKYVIFEVVPHELIDENTKIFVNPTGRFVIGGPAGDTGLTGRKIIVDTYGGYARHGGGAFSGKDPTKVDRSASYAARYLAKNVVAAGLASKCEVQVSYAIGVAHPLSVRVDTFGTGVISDSEIAERLNGAVDLRPGAIIKRFDLRRPIYTPFTAYGHMGREDLGAPWESRDLADKIR